MTIRYFTFSDAMGGSSRQRAFRVVEEMRTRGIDAIIMQPPVLSISRTRWPKKFGLIVQVVRSLLTIQKGDVVYLQRTIANKYFFLLIVVYLTFFRRKMIFDFDDPVYLHSYFKTKTLTRMADAVIVCSHAQLEWAKQFNPDVTVVHIALNFAAYSAFTRSNSENSKLCRIGWVGTGPEHLANLEGLARVLERLVKESPTPFVFELVGAVGDRRVYALFENIPGLRVEFVDHLDWKNPEAAPRKIQTFDIGVVPHQSEGAWNKAKTSFKVLEYMACGVATIVSRFGEMPYIITDGINGYIAASEDEWVHKLRDLLADNSKRAALGRAGQLRVAEEYTFDVIVPRILDIAKRLIKR